MTFIGNVWLACKMSGYTKFEQQLHDAFYTQSFLRREFLINLMPDLKKWREIRQEVKGFLCASAGPSETPDEIWRRFHKHINMYLDILMYAIDDEMSANDYLYDEKYIYELPISFYWGSQRVQIYANKFGNGDKICDMISDYMREARITQRTPREWKELFSKTLRTIDEYLDLHNKVLDVTNARIKEMEAFIDKNNYRAFMMGLFSQGQRPRYKKIA